MIRCCAGGNCATLPAKSYPPTPLKLLFGVDRLDLVKVKLKLTFDGYVYSYWFISKCGG